ncbi:hypothetical protein [Cupriavidus sp. IDO]|uniref:hypothetical protein n=1 Tax=Cupriavidus sp. IDO TaxID=1539142 RepID=UPI00057904AF|nr:hypothetical protein [Cupriavidus sp. IDO]KWR83370.1 hypothetical protein RM96_28320 [Cupriavidus sp. IDO]
MKTIERQCYPGQVHALNLKLGSTLVAKDGALRVEYRDGSLDWLLDAARPFSVKLSEGDHHVLACNAFVKIQTDGTRAVNCLIVSPQSLAAHLLLRMNIAWTSRRVLSNTKS